MGRRAHIIDTSRDIWGFAWDVREKRDTEHGFPVMLGWPQGEGRGRGGPSLIATEPLVLYLSRLRETPADIKLPVGRTTIKRVRAILGHHWRIDRASWWESRTDDLADLTVQEFAKKHDVSTGAIINARHALFGAQLRPAGWWREADVAAILLADRSRASIAEDLGISVGSVGRLRWMLTQRTER